jgi:uncharacterized damage-inducible protein DinB
MFQYNAWANQELFAACHSLTDEQLDVQAPGISGTVRELLMHIAGGQQTMILRTKGRQNEVELNRGSAWPGIDAVVEIAQETSQELISIAGQINDEEEVDLEYFGHTYRYPNSFFLNMPWKYYRAPNGSKKRAWGISGSKRPTSMMPMHRLC